MRRLSVGLVLLAACRMPYAKIIEPVEGQTFQEGDEIDIFGVLVGDRGCPEINKGDVRVLHEGEEVEFTVDPAGGAVRASLLAAAEGGTLELILTSCTGSRRFARDTVVYSPAASSEADTLGGTGAGN
jgi:hypothetical protein